MFCRNIQLVQLVQSPWDPRYPGDWEIWNPLIILSLGLLRSMGCLPFYWDCSISFSGFSWKEPSHMRYLFSQLKFDTRGFTISLRNCNFVRFFLIFIFYKSITYDPLLCILKLSTLKIKWPFHDDSLGVVSLNAHCCVQVKPPECRDHVLVVCFPRQLGKHVAGGRRACAWAALVKTHKL